MTRCIPVILLSVLLSCVNTFAQDSISISDFRYPETRAIDWKGSCSGSLYQGNDKREGVLEGNSIPRQASNHSGSGGLNIRSSFLFFHSKDNHDHSFALDATGLYSSSDRSQQDRDTGSVRSSESHSSGSNFYLDASWTYLHYFSDEGLHLIGSTNFLYSRSHSKDFSQTNNSRSIYFDESTYDNYNLSFHGSLGIGYGRVRDGTLVFRVLRVIERLRDDGVITKQLTREQMLSLVDRIAHRREYLTNFERYEKYFIEDIVEELIFLGAIEAKSVTPFSALRIQEAFRENIQPRFFGWRAFYEFNDVHDQSLGDGERQSSSNGYSSYHRFDNSWEYLHEVGIEFGHPFSLSTHIHSDVSLLVPFHQANTRFQIECNASVTHEVGEKIEIIGSYRYLRFVDDLYETKADEYFKEISHTITGNFVYFVEDRIQFETRISYSWRRSNRYANSVSESRSRSFFLSFGMAYNIY